MTVRTLRALALRAAGLLLCALLSAPAGADQPEVTIGVLAHRGNETALKTWQPTVDYLSGRVPQYRFRLVPLDLRGLPLALEREQLDFVITNPGNYVALEAGNGITRIATLNNARQGRESRVFGAVIFTRADRDDIRELGDLQGKRFAAVDEGAFGGFQMAWRELKDADINPFVDFSELRFTGFPQDNIVLDVLEGRVDAGTVRTDIIEGMAGQGIIDADRIRVLARRYDDDFPFLHSTRLYPEWAFARARRTPETLASEVAVALLQMPHGHPAARAGHYAGWTVPLSYQPVHDLFRELGIGPYALSARITLGDVVRRYWFWLALMLMAILFSVAANVIVKRQVVARTAELSRSNRALELEIAERRRAEEESGALLRENRSLIRKSLALQESERRNLARELHDELGQCISAIQADAAIIRERAQHLDSRLVTSADAIQSVSTRLYGVVHSMMQRLRPPVLDDLGLVETLRGEVEAWRQRQPGVECNLALEGELDNLGEQLNMTLYRIVQECLTNIAKHAAPRRVDIALRRLAGRPGNGIRLVVADDGRGFEVRGRGPGLGLIGMRERVESLSGNFRVASGPGAGTTVTVDLPLTGGEVDAS